MKKTDLLILVALLTLAACSNHTEEKKTETEIKKDTAIIKKVKAPPAETKRPPIINITDTLSSKRIVLYIKDSAASMDRISMKLAQIFGLKLGAFIKKNNIKTSGQPMAWYHSNKAPYFFEAGVPVDKKPSKLPSNIYVREMGVDSVVVAHFYGGYELLPQAYDALKDWIKDHKKTMKGKPYEIYVDDPIDKDGKMKDPYKVQTDIVFPWK